MDRVTSGQPIKITAEDYNRIIRAVEWTESHNGQTGTSGSLELEDGEFWVKNTCSYPLLAYQLCCVATNANGDGIEKAINITDGRTQAISSAKKIPCITQELIEAGCVGRAKFTGVSDYIIRSYNNVNPVGKYITYDWAVSEDYGVLKIIALSNLETISTNKSCKVSISGVFEQKARMATIATEISDGKFEAYIETDGGTVRKTVYLPEYCTWEDGDLVGKKIVVYNVTAYELGEQNV